MEQRKKRKYSELDKVQKDELMSILVNKVVDRQYNDDESRAKSKKDISMISTNSKS